MGRNSDKLYNAVGGPYLSLFNSETLGLKCPEKLLDYPTHLVPANNLPCFVDAIH